MARIALRWGLLAAATLLIGPAAGRLMAGVSAPDGGEQATALLAASSMAGVAAAFGALILTLLTGLATARLTTRRNGLFAAGVVLAWAAFRSATTGGLLRWAQSDGPLLSLAVEAGVIGVVGLGAAWAVCRVAPESTDGESPRVFSGESVLGLAVALAVGAVTGWLVAREGTKGQSLAAAGLAMIAGAAVARVVAPKCHPVGVMASAVLLGAASPLAGLMISENAVAASYEQTLFPLARMVPLDWLAGAYLGVPLGMTWAGSLHARHGKGEEGG